MKLAVPLGGRWIVGKHVVRAVVADDAFERGGEVVTVDRGEPAGFFGELAQAVLRHLQLVLKSSDADAGDVGHLNPAAGYGRWDGALPLLERLASLTD